MTYSADNDITGDYADTTTTNDNYTLHETGSYQDTTYDLTENDVTSTTVTESGDTETGADNSTTAQSVTSTIDETGSDSGGGGYVLHKTVDSTLNQTTSSDDVTGAYTTSSTSTSTSVANETTDNPAGTSTFTETIDDSTTTDETGNSTTGDYSRDITDTTTTTDTDSGTITAGAFSVTESSSQTATGTQTGNNITSAYSLSESVTNSYSMTETGSDFTLAETGSWTGAIDNSGNTIEGNYANSTTGTDSYTMTENGTNSGVPFNETITGTETFTNSETGNPANQTYDNTITGNGSYTLTGTGISATPGSGSYSYETQETADARSGVLNQTQTGTTRYGILERYTDVSNTGGGNSPGNMNFSPYGQPFVDPTPTPWQFNDYDAYKNAVAQENQKRLLDPYYEGDRTPLRQIQAISKTEFDRVQDARKVPTPLAPAQLPQTFTPSWQIQGDMAKAQAIFDPGQTPQAYSLMGTPDYKARMEAERAGMKGTFILLSLVPGGQGFAIVPMMIDVEEGNYGSAFLTGCTAGLGTYFQVAKLGKAATTVSTVEGLTARLSGHTREAVTFVDASEANLLSLLSPARQAQYARGEMTAALRGIAIETQARSLIEGDALLMQYVRLGATNRGPDVILNSGGVWWDITTPASWPAHLTRPVSRGYIGTGSLLSIEYSAMKIHSLTSKVDYGALQIANQAFCNYSFTACGLSRGFESRSEFRECVFSNIKIKKCSVGFPIFDRCRFENVISDRNGVLIYGAAFKECVFSGSIKNVVIGFMWEVVAVYPEHHQQARRFQAENIELAAGSTFAIDVSDADLDFVAFRGEAIVPYVRCARNQAVILRAENLYEKLVHLGRSQANRRKSDFFLATGVLPGCRVGIATINKGALEFLPQIESELRGAGVSITHYGTPG